MAAINLNGFARGYPNQISYPVKAGGTSGSWEVGDFLWYDYTNLTLKSIGGSAGLVTTWSSESQARRAATARFAGIAPTQRRSTDLATTLTLDSCAQFLVTVASSTYKVGDLLGFQKDSGGNYLYAQQLQKVTDPRDAIGVVMEAYSSATTFVRATIISSRDLPSLLTNCIRTLPIALPPTEYAAITNVLLDYTFGYAVRLLNLSFVASAATTGANVFTVKNGSNSLDDTLTVAGSTAAGVITSQDLDDASSYHNFEHNDQLDITCDSGASAGSGTLLLTYMPQLVR